MSEDARGGPEGPGEDPPALAYLDELSEETMRRAWGEDSSPEYRRRIVTAALIFGREFERRVAQRGPALDERGAQRLLMSLMSAVIGEFAAREGMSEEEAASFLGDVKTRDHVLEFDEVLDAHAGAAPGRTLDEVFREAVDGRRQKAAWSDHWSSG